jgi:N-acetylmuramoyl-L-alanine amidase
MAYRWLTDLDQAFANAGIAYIEVPPMAGEGSPCTSWRDRGRPHSTGQWDAQGVLCHHTASPAGTTPQADINVILRGNSEAPGPIGGAYIGRDAQLYLIAAGRSNHGGKGRRPGVDTGGCADMNALLFGIEVGNNGVGEPWTNPVTELYARTVAALCAHYGWTTNDVYLHATTGPPSGGCNSKIDPAGPWLRQPSISTTWDLGLWREFVDEHMGGAPTPNPPQPPGDEDMPTPCGFITCNAGTTGTHVDGSTYRCPVDGTYFRVNSGGTIQWVRGHEQLTTMQSVMAGAGLRSDTWNTPVGDPDVFGYLVGDTPG